LYTAKGPKHGRRREVVDAPGGAPVCPSARSSSPHLKLCRGCRRASMRTVSRPVICKLPLCLLCCTDARTLHGLLTSNPGGAIGLSVCPRRYPVSRLSRSITASRCQYAAPQSSHRSRSGVRPTLLPGELAIVPAAPRSVMPAYPVPLIERPPVPLAAALHVLDLVQASTGHTKHLRLSSAAGGVLQQPGASSQQ
jgi:hypothetical protein